MSAKPGRALIGLLLLCAAAPAWAADPAVDPDWPCVQRKVPTLSVGQMWSGPPAEGDIAADPDLMRLAGLMAPRRTSLDEVKALATDYAGGVDPGARQARMALLFTGILERIDAERRDVMGGISRYAHRQASMADSVKQEEADFAKLRDAPDADPDKVEEAQDKLNWDIRMYRERAQSLTYVCETPVLLEQRAFAIARILAGIS